jgi:hypothetical protein
VKFKTGEAVDKAIVKAEGEMLDGRYVRVEKSVGKRAPSTYKTRPNGKLAIAISDFRTNK